MKKCLWNGIPLLVWLMAVTGCATSPHTEAQPGAETAVQQSQNPPTAVAQNPSASAALPPSGALVPQYLKQAVLAAQVDSLVEEPSQNAPLVCLPAGLPVYVVPGKDGKPDKILINGTSISGWAWGYQYELPTDCRDDGKPIALDKVYVASNIQVPAANIDGDPTALVKNGATFKSGFVGSPLMLNSLKPDAQPPIGKAVECLGRGTRISIWQDSTDMTRTIVESVDPQPKACDGSSVPAHEAGATYYATTRDVANSISWGRFTTGALAVPFKYYVEGDRSISGSAALGAYLGYRIRASRSGNEITLAFFGGETRVTVPSSSSSTTTPKTTDVSGLTFGLGVFASLGDNTSTQAGFVVGEDRLDPNSNWQNNGKLWIAFEIGYPFF